MTVACTMSAMQSRTADNAPQARVPVADCTRPVDSAALVDLTRRVDMELAQRILDEVDRIRPGRVATYGDVAARAGSPSPRLAGWVLSNLADESTPWHRVLRADGTPAPHLAVEQLSRLRAEGVLAESGRVSLKRYREVPH